MRRSLDVSSILSNDDLADYDIISDGHRSLESSIADLGNMARTAAEIQEPPPSQVARDKFGTPALSVEDIQSYVQKAIGASGSGSTRNDDNDQRIVRVYVDGVFDSFNAGHALQLRQAKLSFPLVHLLVGVYSDDLCDRHKSSAAIPHAERCELLRHCRWVDEVVSEAPWRIDEIFMRAHRIDYVAIGEGTSIDPTCDKERQKGYDLVKSLHKAIPTRRTSGLSNSDVKRRRENSIPSTPSSKYATLRGVPDTFQPQQQEKHNVIEQRESIITEQSEDSPFEEPKVEEYGIGIGI